MAEAIQQVIQTYLKLYPNFAACAGRMDQLLLLEERGYLPDSMGADAAAGFGNLKVVQHLRELNIHCTTTGANWAAVNKEYYVLSDLYKHGIQCTSDGFDFLATIGDVQTLSFLISLYQGECLITEDGFDAACLNGQLSMVTYLVENNYFKPSVKLALLASRAGHNEIMEYFEKLSNEQIIDQLFEKELVPK